MGRHQAIRKEPPSESVLNDDQHPAEEPIVIVVSENRDWPGPARIRMEVPVREIRSKNAAHMPERTRQDTRIPRLVRSRHSSEADMSAGDMARAWHWTGLVRTWPYSTWP